MNTFKKTC